MTSKLPRIPKPDTPVAPLYAVIVETRRLFHRLTAAADSVHEDLEITASQRAVLEELAGQGPQTVPGIARRKWVTRQHIQVLVNHLEQAGLVRLRDNPAHRRSQLVELSPAGRACFDEIRAREERVLGRIARGFREHDLVSAAETLRRLTEHLDAVDGLTAEEPTGTTTHNSKTRR